VENARSAGMVKLNERIKHAMDRLQYLMESYLFEQTDLDLNAEVRYPESIMSLFCPS